MEYVLVIVIVLLIVAGFVTFMVLNATRSSGPAAPERPEEEGNPAGILSPDEAPLGDTTEHAGQQEGGRTVGGQDAEHSGGTGAPQHDAPRDRAEAREGASAEGGEPERQVPTPESERLANRPR
jgi:hypothetical protein